MKKFLLVCLSLVLLLSLTAVAEEQAAPADQPMTAETLKTRMAENSILNIFDLRAEESYNEGHIPGSVSFPLDELEFGMNQILNSGFDYMEAEIIAYGEKAEDGLKALEILRKLGFTNVFYLENIAVWDEKLMTLEDEMRLLGQFTTEDIFGASLTQDMLKGYKLTMINVWGTFCNPCISEMPELGKLAQDMKEQGVQIVGLVSDVMGPDMKPSQKKLKLAQDIVKMTKADYPHLLPYDAAFQKILSQVNAVPTTFFVDETGKLVGTLHMGARSYDAWKTIIEDTLEQLP